MAPDFLIFSWMDFLTSLASLASPFAWSFFAVAPRPRFLGGMVKHQEQRLIDLKINTRHVNEGLSSVPAFLIFSRTKLVENKTS
eukprot:11992.XXX_497592_497843_1 [CDS] Oithona nana genome sequencing.